MELTIGETTEGWAGAHLKMPDGSGIPIAGVFKSIEAPWQFAFTWSRESDHERQLLLTITLKYLGDKTELTLR